MKIAYVYDAVYPWVKGGAEKRVYEIAKRLAEKGHDVHWFGLKWWEGDKDIELDGIHMHGIGEWKNLYVGGKRSIGEGIYFGLKTLMKLKGDFDVIDCQQFPYFSCISSKIRSIFKSKFFITWHEIWDRYWFEYLGKKGFFGWLVERIVSKLTDKNIAVSRTTKMNLEKIGVKNVEIIPNGVDFEKIKRVKPNDERSDVIFVGRLIKEKNLDLLLEAIKILKGEISDIKCIIIGDGPERHKLEKIAFELGIKDNVEFKGFLENWEDVISYMKSSKVFCLPSIREGFGIVALEANACALPVVTLDHPKNAVKEFVISGYNGIITNPTPKDFVKGIILSINNETMKKKCIEVGKEFDWKKITNLLENYYSL